MWVFITPHMLVAPIGQISKYQLSNKIEQSIMYPYVPIYVLIVPNNTYGMRTVDYVLYVVCTKENTNAAKDGIVSEL